MVQLYSSFIGDFRLGSITFIHSFTHPVFFTSFLLTATQVPGPKYITMLRHSSLGLWSRGAGDGGGREREHTTKGMITNEIQSTESRQGSGSICNKGNCLRLRVLTEKGGLKKKAFFEKERLGW